MGLWGLAGFFLVFPLSLIVTMRVSFGQDQSNQEFIGLSGLLSVLRPPIACYGSVMRNDGPYLSVFDVPSSDITRLKKFLTNLYKILVKF